MNNTITKLSQAIRIGAKNRPQTIGAYFSVIEPSQHCRMVGSCALGAAYEAVFNNTPIDNIDDTDLFLKLKISKRKVIQHPIPYTKHTELPIPTLIVELNDEYKWTREAIADWLEKEGL